MCMFLIFQKQYKLYACYCVWTFRFIYELKFKVLNEQTCIETCGNIFIKQTTERIVIFMLVRSIYHIHI